MTQAKHRRGNEWKEQEAGSRLIVCFPVEAQEGLILNHVLICCVSLKVINLNIPTTEILPGIGSYVILVVGLKLNVLK